MKIKKMIGKGIYLIAKKMPQSNSRHSLGSKQLRRLCAKMMIDHMGKNVNIEKNASFTNDISIGDFSGLGVNASISGPVTIGKYVMMGPNCRIITENHKTDRTDIPMCLQGMEEKKEVIIEDDVWIGANVTILPGVKIGTGSIIAAGSVVTKNVEKFTVVGGVPAKLIKHRKK